MAFAFTSDRSVGGNARRRRITNGSLRSSLRAHSSTRAAAGSSANADCRDDRPDEPVWLADCEYRDVCNVHWSHDRIHDHFGDGRSVYKAVFALLMTTDPAQNIIKADLLPPLEIVKCGERVYTLSNRRLYALRKYKEVLEHLLGPKTVLAKVITKELVSGEAFTTQNNGEAVEVSQCRVKFCSHHRGERAMNHERRHALSVPPRDRSKSKSSHAAHGAQSESPERCVMLEAITLNTPQRAVRSTNATTEGRLGSAARFHRTLTEAERLAAQQRMIQQFMSERLLSSKQASLGLVESNATQQTMSPCATDATCRNFSHHALRENMMALAADRRRKEKELLREEMRQLAEKRREDEGVHS